MLNKKNQFSIKVIILLLTIALIGCPFNNPFLETNLKAESTTVETTTTTIPSISVATPVISPGTGSYTTAQGVIIDCATTGATIYYTTDGTDPTTSSSVYSSTAINISVMTTLKTKAVMSGYIDSGIASGSYYILPGVDKDEMVSITGGTYTQTDTNSNSFTHTLSSFQMGKYEVTYELWYTVKKWAEKNGYIFETPQGLNSSNNGIGGPPTSDCMNIPVCQISWYSCIVWCNAYSEMSGKNACYTYSGTALRNATDQSKCDLAVCNMIANGYRLPTEGEWQYAASNKGATAPDHISGDPMPYSSSTTMGNYMWYNDNSGGRLHLVGTKMANELGLYDMSGNVIEWCWDFIGNYPTSAQIDYQGAGYSTCCVLRGGKCDMTAAYCLVGMREYSIPGEYASIYSSNKVGFRVVRR